MFPQIYALKKVVLFVGKILFIRLFESNQLADCTYTHAYTWAHTHTHIYAHKHFYAHVYMFVFFLPILLGITTYLKCHRGWSRVTFGWSSWKCNLYFTFPVKLKRFLSSATPSDPVIEKSVVWPQAFWDADITIIYLINGGWIKPVIFILF